MPPNDTKSGGKRSTYSGKGLLEVFRMPVHGATWEDCLQRVRAPASLVCHQASSGAGKGKGKGRGGESPGPTTSSTEWRLGAELDAQCKEVERLKKEQLQQQQVNAAAAKETETSMAVDDTGDGGIKADIKSMRMHLKSLRELPSPLQASPGVAGEIAELDCRLQAAIIAPREAKPLDVQLASSEAHVAKMEKLEAEASQKTAELQEQQAKLARQIDEQLALQAEAEARTLAAKEELAKIKSNVALNLSAEAGAAHAADPAGIVVPPGCVSMKHAEAVLAEQLALRDAALAQAISVAEEAADEPDDDIASVAGSASGTTADEGCKKKMRKQRAIGAKATIAHVWGHQFAKPKWGISFGGGSDAPLRLDRIASQCMGTHVLGLSLSRLRLQRHLVPVSSLRVGPVAFQ